MNIWVAILYGMIGGVTELLPVSFGAHASVLYRAFHLPSVFSGGGLYLRAAITLGLVLALRVSFAADWCGLRAGMRALRRPPRRRRISPALALRRRSALLGMCALLPCLLSLIFTAAAERLNGLVVSAVFLALNGVLIFFASRYADGKKTEKTVMLPEVAVVGAARAVCVLPGLSPVAASYSAGKLCGLAPDYNFRLTYLLALAASIALFFFRFIRAVALAKFTFSLFLPCLLACIVSAICGNLAVQYFKYLLNRGKFAVFSYYCWDLAAVMLILALINS